MNHLIGDPGPLLDEFNPEYIQFVTDGQLRNPSSIFVFLGEHPDTINDGCYMNRFHEYKSGNLPMGQLRSPTRTATQPRIAGRLPASTAQFAHL